MSKTLPLLFLLAVLPVRGTEPADPVHVLPRMVVTVTSDVSFFTVTWRTKGLLPFSKIKRAWFSAVTPGGPADLAGVRVGDELIRLGGEEIVAMTGLGLRLNSLRARSYGTREEIVYRPAGGELRTVEFVYEPIRRKPAARAVPPPSGTGPSPASP